MRKFRAKVDEFGLEDGGVASFTFRVQVLTKGNIYNEHMERGNVPSGYVIDDNACWNKIGTSNFKERFEEITDEKELS